MKSFHVRVLVVFLAALLGPASMASEFVDGRPIFKDVTSSNSGIEMIVPFIEVFDTDADDYPNRIRMQFRIFDPDTDTKVYGNTRRRGEDLPPIPCVNPADYDYDWDLEFLGEGNSYTGILTVFYVECIETATGDYHERTNAYLYMANTGTANGNAWLRRWSQDAASAHITDWDVDSDEEIALVLVNETDTTETVTIKFLNKVSGNQEFSERYLFSTFD